MPIDQKQFLAHVNSEDALTKFVRCHQDLDGILAEIIDEALVESHWLEVERIPFPVKVELTVALGSLRADARSPLLKFNNLRNEFAHKPDTRIDEKLARDFCNVLASQPSIQSMLTNVSWDYSHPIVAVDTCITLLYVLLKGVLQRIRDSKLWNQATLQHVEAILANPGPYPYTKPTVEEEIQLRYDALKSKASRAVLLSLDRVAALRRDSCDRMLMTCRAPLM